VKKESSHSTDVSIYVLRNNSVTVARAGVSIDLGTEFVDYTTVGHAVRHPDDPDRKDVAYCLAIGRALEAAGKRLRRRAEGLVKMYDDNERQSAIAKTKPQTQTHRGIVVSVTNAPPLTIDNP
jgi:hypothetical protein